MAYSCNLYGEHYCSCQIHGLPLQPLWRTLLQLTESIQIDARMTSYQSAVDYCAEQVMPLLHPY